MHIRISSNDGIPIYLQIVNQVKHLVAAGRLEQGDEIPPIRVLAEQLVINPNTVARAYLELEKAGLVTKKHGSGTYISQTKRPLEQREKMKILTNRVDALLAEARHLDVELMDVIRLVRDRNSVMKEQSA